ncbi:MAG TPA: hypothetical protein VL501_02315, partial [Pyrinomonadaceae bacterium]|nr:hypothetical protein [Pyrinomonadaceae bacterium]
GLSLQRVALRIPSVAPAGEATATVDYKLTLKENSALATISPAGGAFFPLSFWYPTPNSWFFVKGADSAPVKIKVTAPTGIQVVSGGTDSAGSYDSRLNSQPFFVAGNWDVTDQNGVSVYMPKGSAGEPQKRAAELAALFAEAQKFMSGVLGSAPQTPLRIVANRRGAGFADAGTVIVDDAVFRRSKIDSLTAMNIAEAAAKLWLGGSVSINGDGYGVISDGLTRYLATQFLESKYGKDVADVDRLRQRNSFSTVALRAGAMAQISPADDAYFPVVANKGAMVWRILAKRVGDAAFATAIKRNAEDGNLDLAELRQAFSAQKELTDYFFDQAAEMDLMAGVPQQAAGEWRVALRNTGPADVTVDVAATTADGERIVAPATIRATSFGEVAFKTPKQVIRAEVDADKLYPQADYSDDIAPRVSTDSDPLLAAKRPFDKQDYAAAETAARALLREYPRADELRMMLGRALLADGKTSEASREFQAVLDEKLPTARSLAWANAGLADVAARSAQNDAAARYAAAAIVAEGEYGASLAARAVRARAGIATTDGAVKQFFADFDKAAGTNRKTDVDALVLSGEITRFVSAVAGSAQAWQTTVKNIDRLDANTVLVEADMNIRLINKNAETGQAVFRLVNTASGWKLAAVETFEVR